MNLVVNPTRYYTDKDSNVTLGTSRVFTIYKCLSFMQWDRQKIASQRSFNSNTVTKSVGFSMKKPVALIDLDWESRIDVTFHTGFIRRMHRN